MVAETLTYCFVFQIKTKHRVLLLLVLGHRGILTDVGARGCCLEPRCEGPAFGMCRNVVLLLPALSGPGDGLLPLLAQLKASLDSWSRTHGRDVYLLDNW